ncbi:MAG: response regulator transcription factor [Sporomusa sp.]
MQVLLAEDDSKLGRLIKYMLEKADIQVDWVTQGDMALDYAIYSSYDVVILDWMMPVQTGIYVCDQLRKQGYQNAILMLTAKDALEDRVLGLDTGADDYLVKPFEFTELLARIRALARRSSAKLQDDIVELGNLMFHRSTRSITQGMSEIQLTSREFQLLDLLVQNRGHVVPRDVILDKIWGLETDISSNNLDAYVRLLRKKINWPDANIVLQSIRGIGYKLEDHNVY